MEHRRLIDLQPLPPPTFHQQYPHHHHHHHLRFEHVVPHPPNFIPHNHFPQPPPPQPQQPLNRFPQLLPPQPHQQNHFPQPPPQNPHQPHNHFPQSPPQQPYQPHNQIPQLLPPQPSQPHTHFPRPLPPQPHNHFPQPPPPQPHNHYLQPPPLQPHNHYPRSPPPQPHRQLNHFLPTLSTQLHQPHFPPPLPPQPQQPHIHTRLPPPQPCQSCFDLPPHRFHHYQIDLPPKPCHSNFLHPPPPSLPLPETQENTDQLFHRGENSRDGRIEGCVRGLNDERDNDEKRCARVKNNPDSKKMVYDETSWGSIDQRRMSSGISKVQFVRSKKRRRLQKVAAISCFQSGIEDNGGNEELSGGKEGFECLQTRTDDNRETEALSAPPCPDDDVKTDINTTIVETGITTGSPTTAKSGEDVVKADLLADDVNGSGEIDDKDQSHKDMIAMSRFQSGKDCSRDNGGDEELSGRSFLRGKEKEEGFVCLQTRTDGKRESEAILAPNCADDVKTNMNSTIVETGITSGSPGSPTTSKSAEDVVKADLLADDALGTSKELLDQSFKDMIGMSRLLSGKDCSRDNGDDEESSGRSFVRGKEKQEGFECLQTRTDDKRASKAILAPTCPEDVKTDINSMIVETGITSGSPTTSRSVGDLVKADLLADDALGTSKELLEKNVVFESGLYKDRDYDERRMGIGISEGHFVRCRKKRRLQKECVMSRIQSGKEASGGDEESSGGSFRGKENKGTECLQTRTDDERESEAILAPPCPDVKAAGMNSTLVEAKITSGLPATAKSDKDVLKFVVSESGNWGDGANGSGEIAVKDQLQMWKVKVDDVAKADGCIFVPSAPTPPRPCSDAKNQPQRDTNLHSPIVRKVSRSALRKKLKRTRIKFLRKTSVQMRNSCGGDAVNANNDYIFPSASMQPRSVPLTDSGEIAAKSRPPQKHVNLHSPIACVQSRSARRKKARQKYKNNLHIPDVIESHITKRKAKNKISHETGMLMINDRGDIINVSDCIIPSAPPQPSSGTNILGQIVAKSRPPKHTNLQCPSVKRSHSTCLKKWKARNKLLQETSIVSEKAGSNCDPCKPVAPNLNLIRSNSTTISASPYVADSVIPECAERLVTSTEDEKVQQFVHQTFLAKVSSGQYAKLGTDRVDDISEHPLHNGLPLVDSFLEGINIAGSSQGDRWSSEIHACSERDSALPLKPNNSDMGSADTNAYVFFLKELNAREVVSSEVNISSEANNAVSSKIWRQKCFECGELEQCSSLCLKVKAANNAVNLKVWRQKCFECGELGHSSSLCPKVKAANSVVSSNIRRRMCFNCGGHGHISSLCPKVKCYECGKCGHISLLCPKVKAANNAVSSEIRRRKCYECGEFGHISLFCPNVKADDSTNPDKETGELKGYTHVMLDAVTKKGTVTNIKSSSKDTQVQSVVNDVQVSATRNSNPVGSSKIRKRETKRKCYDCRDSGHIKSFCPKIKADDSANADKETRELKGYTHVKLDNEAKKGTMTNLKSAPKEYQVHSSYNFSAVNEVQVTASSKTNLASSSKIRKRKCFECREFGHIMSLCPNKKAYDSANAECDGALPLKPDSGVISDVGSADANSKEIFPKELNTPQAVTSEVNFNSQANYAVSSKNRKRKSYGCGELGYISLLCPKVKADDSKNPDKKLDDAPKKGTVTNLKLAPKDDQVQSSLKSAVNEVQVIATSKANPVGSSTKRWQTWNECRECGHFESSCPKMNADDLAIAISKYISRYLLAAPHNR